MTINDVLPACVALYALPGHGVGGCLHIVLEDGNLKNHHVQFCVDYAREQDCPTCQRIAADILALSMTQRRKLRARLWRETSVRV